jgi:hypothetical protein
MMRIHTIGRKSARARAILGYVEDRPNLTPSR